MASPTLNEVAALAALKTEIVGYRALLHLLREEQDALRGARADALPGIAAAKLRQVDKLRALGSTRDAATDGRSENTEIEAARDELFRVAADARRNNEINGRMIAVQQHHFDRALSALLNAAGVTPLYGADGRTQGALPPRTFAAI